MDDLIAWLRVQLDRQQAALTAYRDHRAGLTPCVNVEGDDPELASFDEHDSCAIHLRTAEETEYRDVAYGLAEVEAKRRVLELWTGNVQFPDYDGGYASAMEDVLKLLALPYADRPGYLPEWRPSDPG